MHEYIQKERIEKFERKLVDPLTIAYVANEWVRCRECVEDLIPTWNYWDNYFNVQPLTASQIVPTDVLCKTCGVRIIK